MQCRSDSVSQPKALRQPDTRIFDYSSIDLRHCNGNEYMITTCPSSGRWWRCSDQQGTQPYVCDVRDGLLELHNRDAVPFTRTLEHSK